MKKFTIKKLTMLVCLAGLIVTINKAWAKGVPETFDLYANGFVESIAAQPSGSGTLTRDHFARFRGVPPTLGNYPATSVALSNNVTVTPDAAPISVARINVSTNTIFKGTFAADPITGVVRITDAHPAGTYTVTVTAFDSGGAATTKTFQLTVNTGTACTGSTTFTNAADNAVSASPFFVGVGDFNNDGNQDLAVAHYVTAGTISILLGNGTGNFTAAPSVVVNRNPRSIAVGDFDGDGNQDLAVPNQLSANVSILKGDGVGGFTRLPDVAVGTFPTRAAIGDFNGDGKQDLAVTSYNNVSGFSIISIRLGDGAGNFTVAPDVTVPRQPFWVAVGDFNGDGNQDIATANQQPGTVSIRLGDGAGNFSGTTDVTVGSGPSSIVIGDFNNDGNQDFITGNVNSSNVSIRLGDGIGNFSGTTNIAVGSQPYYAAIADFNNDGNQDFAASLFGSTSVPIRLGNGMGSFTGTTNVPVGTAPLSVAVGDFNGDGKQDFASSDANSSNISIRLGTCIAPTAATVSISGRVSDGRRGVSNAVVHITDQNGNIRMTRTNPFGYYRFNGVEVGQNLLINVFHKQYQFTPQVITIGDTIENLDFTAQEN